MDINGLIHKNLFIVIISFSIPCNVSMKETKISILADFR